MSKYWKAYDVVDTLLHLMSGEEREDGYKPTQEEMSKAMADLKELVEENQQLKQRVSYQDVLRANLNIYKKALRLAILDVADYGSNWSFIMGSSKVNNQYDEDSDSIAFYDKLPLSDVERFYVDESIKKLKEGSEEDAKK
jgi:hypothetical protein